MNAVEARELQVARDTIQALEDHIAMLEDALGLRTPMPPQWGLTGTEEKVLGMLLARDILQTEQIMAGLYAHKAADEPHPKIASVYICKLRQKLRARGVSIGNLWGRGWFLDARSKQTIRDALAQRPAA